MAKKNNTINTILSIFLGVLSLAWIYPVVMIFFNSLKKETSITTSGIFTKSPEVRSLLKNGTLAPYPLAISAISSSSVETMTSSNTPDARAASME